MQTISDIFKPETKVFFVNRGISVVEVLQICNRGYSQRTTYLLDQLQELLLGNLIIKEYIDEQQIIVKSTSCNQKFILKYSEILPVGFPVGLDVKITIDDEILNRWKTEVYGVNSQFIDNLLTNKTTFKITGYDPQLNMCRIEADGFVFDFSGAGLTPIVGVFNNKKCMLTFPNPDKSDVLYQRGTIVKAKEPEKVKRAWLWTAMQSGRPDVKKMVADVRAGSLPKPIYNLMYETCTIDYAWVDRLYQDINFHLKEIVEIGFTENLFYVVRRPIPNYDSIKATG